MKGKLKRVCNSIFKNSTSNINPLVEIKKPHAARMKSGISTVLLLTIKHCLFKGKRGKWVLLICRVTRHIGLKTKHPPDSITSGPSAPKLNDLNLELFCILSKIFVLHDSQT